MSVINDALKKAGQPILADLEQKPKRAAAFSGQPKAPKAPPAVLEGARAKKRPAAAGLFIVALLALAATPFLLPIFSPGARSAPDGSPKRVSAGTDVSAPSGQFTIEEAPRPMTPPPPALPGKNAPAGGFKLSGVVTSEKESYCLINGRVLIVGETVNGATIERIGPREVTLDRGGEKITLPVEG